jgi:hypothetical protein
MGFKTIWKLSAPMLALMLAAACSDGQDMNPQEEPASGEVNTEEPASGDTNVDEPAGGEVNTEEPASGDTNAEEPTNK